MYSNKFLKSTSVLALAVLVLASCSSEDTLTSDWIESNTTESSYSFGSLDPSKMISVGASFTAGFHDGGLFESGQANAFPSIVANQLSLVNQSTTGTPLGDTPLLFNNPNTVSSVGTGRIAIDLAAALAFLENGQGSLGDALVNTPGDGLTPNTNSPINNFGVPGLRAIDVAVQGYGSANPYFGAFQSGQTASVLGDAVAANPSFFTVFLGGNDVLGYSLAGGVNDESNPLDPTTISSVANFSAAINGTLDALTANGAHGVILNVPPVTLMPYFQVATELSGGVKLLPAGSIDAATAGYLNSVNAYGAYNAGIDQVLAAGAISQAEAARRKINFEGGVANAPVITDESLTDLSGFNLPSIRQASAGNPALGIPADIFPLDAIFVIGVAQGDGSVYGVSAPLPDQYTLTASEQAKILTAVGTFNAIIAQQASARSNVTLVDTHPLVADLFGLSSAQAAALGFSGAGVQSADGVQGVEVGGINMVPISLSSAQLYNSVWSTDFVHLNPRGSAMLANEVIKVLNATYGANIPEVDPLTFEPINAPF